MILKGSSASKATVNEAATFKHTDDVLETSTLF